MCSVDSKEIRYPDNIGYTAYLNSRTQNLTLGEYEINSTTILTQHIVHSAVRSQITLISNTYLSKLELLRNRLCRSTSFRYLLPELQSSMKMYSGQESDKSLRRKSN